MKILLVLSTVFGLSGVSRAQPNQCNSAWIVTPYKSCAHRSHGPDLMRGPVAMEQLVPLIREWGPGETNQEGMCKSLRDNYNSAAERVIGGIQIQIAELYQPTPTYEWPSRNNRRGGQEYRYQCTVRVNTFAILQKESAACGLERDLVRVVNNNDRPKDAGDVKCLTCQDLRGHAPRSQIAACVLDSVNRVYGNTLVRNQLSATDRQALVQAAQQVIEWSGRSIPELTDADLSKLENVVRGQ